MQVLLVVIGIGLIVVGLYFAVGGFAQAQAGAGAKSITVQGPAWLVLVGIGVALLLFAAIYEDEDDTADNVDASATTSSPMPASPTTASPTTASPTTASPTTTDQSNDESESESESDESTEPSLLTEANQSECFVSIDNPLVPLHETPDPFGYQIMRVPLGQHSVLDSGEEIFAGTTTRWLLLSIDGQEGWIQDNTIFIASKSGCSP